MQPINLKQHRPMSIISLQEIALQAVRNCQVYHSLLLYSSICQQPLTKQILCAYFVGVVFVKNIIFLFLRGLSLYPNYVLCKLASEISCTAIRTIGSDVISSFRQDQLMFFKFFFYELTRLPGQHCRKATN